VSFLQSKLLAGRTGQHDHLCTALTITVLHASSRLLYTVRQLYHQDMQCLSTFVYACNCGFPLVTTQSACQSGGFDFSSPQFTTATTGNRWQPLASAGIPAMSDIHHSIRAIWLPLGMCLGHDVPGKCEDVIGLKRVFCSVGGGINGKSAGLKNDDLLGSKRQVLGPIR
jgi:hypothetical protein